jgi:hypothetical protein
VGNIEPYCGRNALYDPYEIYEAGETYIRDGVEGQKFDVQTFPQVTIDSRNAHNSF